MAPSGLPNCFLDFKKTLSIYKAMAGIRDLSDNLSALSQILDCSLPDLLGLDTEESILSDEITINLSLYSQTVELIISLLKERQILINDKELFKAVK